MCHDGSHVTFSPMMIEVRSVYWTYLYAWLEETSWKPMLMWTEIHKALSCLLWMSSVFPNTGAPVEIFSFSLCLTHQNLIKANGFGNNHYPDEHIKTHISQHNNKTFLLNCGNYLSPFPVELGINVLSAHCWFVVLETRATFEKLNSGIPSKWDKNATAMAMLWTLRTILCLSQCRQNNNDNNTVSGLPGATVLLYSQSQLIN